ncbi:MAG: ATP-binding protein [Burkholderiales bacterium]
MKSAVDGTLGSASEDIAGGFYKIPALRILSEITTSLSSDNDIEALLERFLTTMIKLAGAGAGAVRILTPNGAQMRLVAAVGLPLDVLEREQLMESSCGVCGEAMRDNRILSTTDFHICTNRTGSDYFGQGSQKMLAVPLQYKGRVLGIYNLFLAANHEIPEDVSLLFRSISEHLGMALENARLMQENLRVTLMNERQMMANEIHDSLAQTLAYMKMRMTLLQDAVVKHDELLSSRYLGDVNQALGSAYKSLRELITRFRSRMDPRGLLPALEEIVDSFHDKTGVTLEFINRTPDLDLMVDQEVQVFHIVQEALANISHHSHARHARLSLDEKDGHYLISIEDDGVGMPDRLPGAVLQDASGAVHFGLSIMRERAQRLGGAIETESVGRKGTCVRLIFPSSSGRRASAG